MVREVLLRSSKDSSLSPELDCECL